MGPQASLLPDGRRLHLNHGPIDLIIEAYGADGEIAIAYQQVTRAFGEVLSTLVTELQELRLSDPNRYLPSQGPVARRMVRAVAPHAETFVTPMAAVAGAVADHMLAALVDGRKLDRAYVNNGGDCAVYLSNGYALKLGAVADGQFGEVCVGYTDPVRGVATSGWRGRSHSLGIADAVTVLAKDAAMADVAATLIANAVDLPGHPSVTRAPASDLNPDSDLGDRLVTVDVGPLSDTDASAALERGLAVAHRAKARGLIEDALLFLCGMTRQTTKQRMLVHG